MGDWNQCDRNRHQGNQGICRLAFIDIQGEGMEGIRPIGELC